MILNFGKFKGKNIDFIDDNYLAFLSGNEKYNNPRPFKWIQDNYPEAIVYAKKIYNHRLNSDSRLCEYCGGVLSKIGRDRTNGVYHHNDWIGRKYHKKCYKERYMG